MMQIVILLALGWAVNKFHLVSRSTEQVLSKFVTLLFLPSLVLYSFMINCDFSALVTYGHWVLVGAACVAVSLGIALLLAPRFAGANAYLKGVYRYAFAFPNTGGIWTPLLLAFYGTQGLFLNSMFTFVLVMLTYTWGIMQLQPVNGYHNLRFYLRRLFNVNVIVMLIGMILGLLGAKNWMSSVIVTTMEDLSSCYVTTALLLTGFSIADYPFHDVLRSPKVYLYSRFG